MYNPINAWLQFSKLFFKSNDEKLKHLKTNCIHYHIRQDIAERLFTSDYDKLGIFIQVTEKQYNELFDIEGGKLKPNKNRDDELIAKLKDILHKKFKNDPVD